MHLQPDDRSIFIYCGPLSVLFNNVELSLWNEKSLILTVFFVVLDTCFLAFARQLMDNVPCGGVFALGVFILKVFCLFVQHVCFAWFAGVFQIENEPPPTFSLLLWLGDKVPSLGFIFLHLQLESLVSRPTWQTTSHVCKRFSKLLPWQLCSSCWYYWVIGTGQSLHLKAWKLFDRSSWNCYTEVTCSFFQLKLGFLRVFFFLWWFEVCKQAQCLQSYVQITALLNCKLWYPIIHCVITFVI